MSIKPKELERFIENCDDPALVGRVAFSLVGKTINLSTMEQTVVGMLRGAMEDFDEAMEKERKRKESYRRKRLAEENGTKRTVSRNVPGTKRDKTDVPGTKRDETVVPCILPTSLPTTPSVLPTSQHTLKCVCANNAPGGADAGAHTHTRTRGIDLETILRELPGKVTEEYARWWHSEMSAADWVTVEGKPITEANWKAVLLAWWKNAKPEELAAAKAEKRREAEKLKAVDPAMWTLCRERCANCRGTSCAAGVKTPPAANNHPPEECPKFKLTD